MLNMRTQKMKIQFFGVLKKRHYFKILTLVGCELKPAVVLLFFCDYQEVLYVFKKIVKNTYQITHFLQRLYFDDKEAKFGKCDVRVINLL